MNAATGSVEDYSLYKSYHLYSSCSRWNRIRIR